MREKITGINSNYVESLLPKKKCPISTRAFCRLTLIKKREFAWLERISYRSSKSIPHIFFPSIYNGEWNYHHSHIDFIPFLFIYIKNMKVRMLLKSLYNIFFCLNIKKYISERNVIWLSALSPSCIFHSIYKKICP